MIKGREMNSMWKLLKDLSSKAGITEVIVNDLDNVFIEREGEFIRLSIKLTQQDLKQFASDVAQMSQRQYDEVHPILDARLPDGSRINIIHELYTSGIPAITIRKYLKNIKSFDSVPGIFSLDEKAIQFLKAIIKSRMNIVVAGGTGAGKTTLLNMLLQEVPQEQRIVTIEDTRELTVNCQNKVCLESRGIQGLGIRDLVKNTLRMRPDRIIIGEVRGEEMFDLLQAMNTGHRGSMTSLHANNPGESITRMENLFMLAGHDIPIKAIRFQISNGIDFIIQINRTKEGQRVITKISEITGMESERVTMQDIASYDYTKKKLVFSGLVPKQIKDLVEVGLTPDHFQP